MNALRKIKKVENGKVEIDLPKDYNGKNVEVIVLIDSDASTEKISKAERKKSIRKFAGVFKKYANPDLIPFEKEIAWKKVAEEKYGIR